MLHTAGGDLSFIYQVAFAVNSNGYGIYSAQNYLISSFTNDQWTQVEVDLTTVSPAPMLDQINAVAVFPMVAGSGTAPATVDVYVDDIWLE